MLTNAMTEFWNAQPAPRDSSPIGAVKRLRDLIEFCEDVSGELRDQLEPKLMRVAAELEARLCDAVEDLDRLYEIHRG